MITARTVAAVEGTGALATASHSIAAAFGYPDGEQIPLDLMLEQVKRIVDSTDLPVTADLEGGYGNAPETIRRAIGLGVVGANIEDQLKPLPEAAAAGRGDHEGGRGGRRGLRAQRPDRRLLAEPEGRPGREPRQSPSSEARPTSTPARRSCSFRRSSPRTTSSQLVDAYGPQRLTTIGIPGMPARDWQQAHGVARTSYGPLSQNVALTALQELVEEVHRGGGVPANLRILN